VTKCITLAAAEKVAGQLRWQHEKQLRQIGIEREEVLLREVECLRAFEARKRIKAHLQYKEESLEDEKQKLTTHDLKTWLHCA
jgi:hypothetical protein